MVVNSHPLYQLSYRGSHRPGKLPPCRETFNSRPYLIPVVPAINPVNGLLAAAVPRYSIGGNL